MPCPLCGDICRCSSEERLPPPSESSSPENERAWRAEVAARLNRYQARHRPRPPRYPSLRLRFEPEETARPRELSTDPAAFPERMATVSNRALALDEFAAQVPQTAVARSFPAGEPVPAPASSPLFSAADPVPPQTTAKIIEFPRSWTPTPRPVDELAEPVLDRPRILEAPEIVPPPPALGGITIEPARRLEVEKRPGIDIPLQSAPLLRRLLSAAIDGLIIAAACGLFGFIFWKMTAIRPPRLQLAGLATGMAMVFWATYQYLLLVYSGSTPGLLLTRLELARFDGSRAGRHLRRWRVLASFLSAASIGMGYLWVFLDEDDLCWHDRITQTYLAPRDPDGHV